MTLKRGGCLEVGVLSLVSLGVRKAESLQGCISLPQRNECLVGSLNVLLLFPSLFLKKGELLSLQQVPSLLEKVVGTSEPFPLPTAVLLGCAGQRPLKSVFIF